MITINSGTKLEWKPGLTIADIRTLSGYQDSPHSVFLNGKVILKKDYQTCDVPDNVNIKFIFIAQGG